MSLLELVIASSMLAVVMTSLSLVLRSARTAWDANDSNYAAVHHATTVARHIVRTAREVRRVLELPAAGNLLAVELADGSQMRWHHTAADSNGNTDVVLLRDLVSGTDSPLAFGIRDLSFVGYEADGSTQTTNMDDIQLIEVQVTVDTPTGASAQETVKSKVWIRSW